MTGFEQLPGLIGAVEANDETTLVVERDRLREAALHLRDKLGFNFLSDIAATDYLGWGGETAGSWGSAGGRDLNVPYTLGLDLVPESKPKRFSVSYHLLALRDDPTRVRLQIWLDEGETVASVVSVWPVADWLERECYDLMGIVFENHPNLVRILTPDDWEGHPLRKDYPIGGEPVRFSEEV
ncbi:MAG: NADH-quinone oxidoreductase subunit C [Gaiellaceae bacterium]